MEYIGLQAFQGTKVLEDILFYEYRISWHINDKRKNKILGSYKNKLKLTNNFNFIYYIEDFIYSKEKLILPEASEFLRIDFLCSKKLNVSSYKNLYSAFITYCINKNLIMLKDDKYIISYTNEILTRKIFLQNGKEIDVKSEKDNLDKIELLRKFYIYPEVNDDGSVLLYLSCSSEFKTYSSIFDFLNQKRNVVGLNVKNKWNNIKGIGEITAVSKYKINDKIEGFDKKGDSLVGYQKYINCYNRVKDFTEKDLNSNCVKVKFFGSNLEYLFIPHSLEPVITWDYIKKEHKEFGQNILKYIKMNMDYRIKTMLNFIKDIGSLEHLSGLSFDFKNYKFTNNIGFTAGKFKFPKYSNGERKLDKKDDVFSLGFYNIPNEKEVFSVLYPKGYLKEAKTSIRAIYDFLLNYNGYNNNRSNVTYRDKKELIHIETNKYKYEFIQYNSNEKSEFLSLAKKINDKNRVKFAIVLIDDNVTNGSLRETYGALKKSLLDYNIESQMMDVKTARKLSKENKNSIYYLKNICLGILGKLGGMPWVLADIKHKYDCFIGLDVASINNKIHYTACSFLFGQNYEKIYTFKPKSCQIGEKIPNNILKQIFDNVLNKYKDEYNKLPKNLVIHRDGFSREDIEWEREYFESKKIEFNIIEIKKKTFMRFFELKENKILNPKEGTYIVKDDMAYIVTTNIGENWGAPMPLNIRKAYGNISMKEALEQVYYLAKIHVGSTFSTRLPITTEYADKTCKSIQYVLNGKTYDKLFFL